MQYIFQYKSGIIDIRDDIPEKLKDEPHITVEDDFTLLPNSTLELDFENNKVTQTAMPEAPKVEEPKTTEELIVDAINDI